MEDDLQEKWKMNQSTQINLISCDIIVNSPSFMIVNCHSFRVLTKPCFLLCLYDHYGRGVPKSRYYSLVISAIMQSYYVSGPLLIFL